MARVVILEEVAMKHQLIRITAMLSLLLLAAAAAAGTWSTNNFFYEPALGARGAAEHDYFETGLERVDAHLGRYKTLGDPGYTTLAEALTTIGTGTRVTLTIPAGPVPVGANTIIPDNIHLRVLQGADFQVADGATLTIQGRLEAGPYQIFSWTGTGKVDLSASPTAQFFLQWWGAKPGLSNDCKAAFDQAVAASGSTNFKTIKITKGLWRIASPLTINKTYGLGLEGDGVDTSGVWIDVGAANNGLTFGNTTPANTFQWHFKDIAFVGPSNACKNGLRFIQAHHLKMENVNLYMGTAEYGMSVEGCIWADLDVLIGHNFGGALYTGATRVTDGIHISPNAAAFPYKNNVMRLRVRGTTMRDGVVLTDTLSGANNEIGYPIIISGSLENCSRYPIYAENWTLGEIQDFYLTDLNVNYAFYLKKCRNIKITSVQAGNDSGTVCGLENSHNIKVANSRITILNIDAACRGVVVENTEIVQALNDNAPDTVYLGWTKRRSGPHALFANRMPDRVNLLPTLLNRWQSDRPDGWGVYQNTWTKCGTGQSDTTKHIAPYCAKFTTNGGTGIGSYSLSSTQLALVLGRSINFTAFGKIPAGQSFTSYPALYLNVTLPAWAASTSYKVGEEVTANGYTYLCIKAGVSGSSPPAWPTTFDAEVVDNSIIWRGTGTSSANSASTTPFTAGDVGGDWKKLIVNRYIPPNATAVSLSFYVYRQSGSNEGMVYWAEPCLMIGNQGPDSVVLSHEEMEATVLIGSNKITFGSAIPTSGWAQRGDVHFNTNATAGSSPGWVCTTAGLNGSTAVWKAMGNLAN